MDNPPKIRQLTTGTHDFPTLMGKPGAKYIDKTDLLYELATDNESQFFISRPRRFGKSLMLSTLQAMFEGRRDLFKGLKIDEKDWECWDEKNRYPVYNFSMTDVEGETYPKVRAALEKLTKRLCDAVELPYDPEVDASINFGEFIKAAAAKSPTKKIVVLIDEYDVPVQGFLDSPKELNRVRKLLHDFYEKLKTNSDVIRFLMMTGVTKLTKLSVFSGLTHLTDLSGDRRFSALLGYTREEIGGALRENVEALAARLGMDFASTEAKIFEWYDGYRFSPQNDVRVVNPVSLGNLFSPGGGEFKSYWETTGGTSLVFNRIKASGKLPADLENVRVRPIQLDVCDAERLPMESLLYQSGYLTIKEVIHSDKPEDRGIAARDIYRLAPPNEEIRQSLHDGYVSMILGFEDGPFETLLDRAKRQIAAGDIQEVVETLLYSLYASIPPDWQIKDEAEAKRYFLLFMSMCGANPGPEFPSVRGYADAVVETPDNVFVFEFKYKRSAKAAIKQIKDRNYAAKWLGGPRPVTLIGINFNPKVRNIDMPVIERERKR